MRIIPKSKVESLQFCESHAPIWNAGPAAVGLTAAQTAAFKALTQSARAAYDAAQSARQAYRAAVTAQDVAIAQATSNAADLVRVIKGFAELSVSPDAIYALAQIPTAAAPVPASAPGKPTDISVVLESSGAITVAWSAIDASASSGAFFNISRKLPGQTTFVPLGGVGGATTESRRMSFTDATIPAGAAGTGTQYVIVGHRGTKAGQASDAITVQFGVDVRDGVGTFAVGADGSLKMAA